MKRCQSILVFTWLTVGSAMPALAATETYDIDPIHTWVGFNVRHFFTKVPGSFTKVKGSIVVDRDQLENSTVETVIEVASRASGIQRYAGAGEPGRRRGRLCACPMALRTRHKLL